jgi:adenosylcobinamide kinase / adenosylcobinamide-phosphate guanylyltransferase
VRSRHGSAAVTGERSPAKPLTIRWEGGTERGSGSQKTCPTGVSKLSATGRIWRHVYMISALIVRAEIFSSLSGLVRAPGMGQVPAAAERKSSERAIAKRGKAMGKLVLVLGGARSGKSSYAQRMAEESGQRVCYVATAEARDGEMDERIRRHRDSRPAGWKTLELSGGTALEPLPPGTELALMDCFTVFLSNLMAANGLDWPLEDEGLMPEAEVERLAERTGEEAVALVDSLCEVAESVIVVSNEVGEGVVPPYRLGRIFRDLAGRLNQQLAERACEVILVVAGIPLRLKAEGGEDADG